jgi:hypothetical protein
MTELGYEYRHDGNFLIKRECVQCKEEYTVHAMQNSNPSYPGWCSACIQVRQWERESEVKR